MMAVAGARCRALAILLPLLVVGCAGSLFKTQVAPPTMYMLSAEAAGDTPGAAAVSTDLAVLKPRVRAGLDTERIAALYADRHLDYFADARWSGPLDQVVQDLAVQVFHSRAGLRNVSGDASAFASAYWLEIEVADFQAEYPAEAAGSPPTVHAHFLARIGGSGERRIIARFEAETREPAASNRMSAIVEAYNRAANQALMQIESQCMTALAPAVSQSH